MKLCSRCGYSNIPDSNKANYCPRCGSLLKYQSAPSAESSQGILGLRTGLLAAILALAAFVIIAGAYFSNAGKLRSEQARLAAELASMEENHRAELAAAKQSAKEKREQEDFLHQQRLNDPSFISGQAARERHAAEWARRLSHDSAFATTAMEKALLKMERLGRDPAVSARAALQEVAIMALPAGSQVQVVDAGAGFEVRTAFKISAIDSKEKGAITKHHSTESMRHEIEEISARLFQDLFDYCGSRGINRLSVSCNHTIRRGFVPQAATQDERRQILKNADSVMASLYRVSMDASQITSVRNWRNLSIPQVIRLMRIDNDGLRNLTIEGQATLGDQQDAQMPLEF